MRIIVACVALFCSMAGVTGLQLPAVYRARGILRAPVSAPRVKGNDVEGAKPDLTAASVEKCKLGRLVQSVQSPSRAVASVALLIGIEKAVGKGLAAAGSTFPAPLAAMLSLATVLVASDAAAPSLSKRLMAMLQPGTALLGLWMPVFFAPSLIALPLCALPDAATTARLGAITLGGFVATLVATGHTAALVARLTSKSAGGAGDGSSAPAKGGAKAGGFEAKKIRRLAIATAAACTLASVKLRFALPFAAATQTVGLLGASLTSYAFGTLMPRKVQAVVHPLVTTLGLTSLTAAAMGAASGTGYLGTLSAYIGANGAGALLLSALSPAVVSFALPLYLRRKAIAASLPTVTAAVATATGLGIFGTAYVVKAFAGAATSAQALSLLTRSITTPLAMTASKAIGADVNLAVAAVVITGLFGAAVGPRIMDAFKVPQDPVARGLAMGGAAHGLGTAALAAPGGNPEAAAFAAIAMSLTGTLTSVALVTQVVQTAVKAIVLV